jgi:hypothetical protein
VLSHGREYGGRDAGQRARHAYCEASAAVDRHAPFFSGLPEHGIWTPLALTRTQFVLILAVSLALFLFVDGPVWHHVRASHFRRITVSYALIPVSVAAALWRNHRACPMLIIGGSAVLAAIKLVLTAGLLVALAIAG